MAIELEKQAPFATVEEAIEDIREGKFVVVVDAADRENEGDLTIAAQFATPEAINFMATHGRGLICLCLTEERCDELGLQPMTDRNETPFGTAFTVSIEAREGVATGISAHDRSRTVQVAIDRSKGPDDLVRPGHIFPLRARDGGVLQRGGQTEASVDLARLAGLIPAGVVCEIMNEDGTMARVDDLIPYCERHGLKLVTIADLIEYRRRHEKLVERTTAVRMPTAYGEFTAVAFREKLTGRFRGLNHPRLRPDNVYLPDFQGVIETEDGAKIAFDYRGYGRPREYGREIVGTAFHSTGDERYARLNDAVAVLTGKARTRERTLRLEIAELVFEPLANSDPL